MTPEIALWVQGGATGIVAYIVWLILTGRLVPKSTLDREVEEKLAWRNAYLKAEAARSKEQVNSVVAIEAARTGAQALTALRRIGEVGDDDEVAAADPPQGKPVEGAAGPKIWWGTKGSA